MASHLFKNKQGPLYFLHLIKNSFCNPKLTLKLNVKIAIYIIISYTHSVFNVVYRKGTSSHLRKLQYAV